MDNNKIIIPYDIVKQMASIQCSIEEIASYLNCNESILLADNKFMDIYNSGIKAGKSNLRRLQFEEAKQGNSTMLVWLGKQYLNQTDKNKE